MGIRSRPWVIASAAAGCLIAIGCVVHWTVLQGSPNALERVLWPGSYLLMLLFSPAPEPLWVEFLFISIAACTNAVLYGAVAAGARRLVEWSMRRSNAR